MVLMFQKRALMFMICLGWLGFLCYSLGSAEALGSESSMSRSETAIATLRFEPFVLAFADDESAKSGKEEPRSAENRGGLTEFQEKALIVGITILIAFVIAWKLAGRSQEDIQRLLNRSKRSADSDETGQKTEAELSTAIPQDVKPDTVPEIPAVCEEDTEHDLPASDDR